MNITALQAAFANDQVKVTKTSAEVWIERFGEDGGKAIAIHRALPAVDRSKIAQATIRRRGHGEVQIAESVYVTIALPNDASRVGSSRNEFDFAWSRTQWSALDANIVTKIGELLDRREARSIAANADRKAKYEAMSASTAAKMEQQNRILARLPTEDVDRYIVEHMDCPAERFAGFGKATRRSWRKRARQEMMKS